MKTYIQLLRDFVNKRPGLDFADYGDISVYRHESREITNDKHDFNELLMCAIYEIGSEHLDAQIKRYLQNNSRLTLNNGKLNYCVGQYFPTEYRPSACRVLVSILWKHAIMVSPESDGLDIRAYFKKRLNKRTYKNYFA